MTTPHDQSARERFANELDANFSVVASAGSGKTRAITDRIVAIAESARAIEWLPSLVVVTFTNRAADEMQQRARQRILEAGVNPNVMAAFNRAFFGTIHSFCVRLLRAQGHLLGLRGEFDSSRRDDDALWMEFVQQYAVLGGELAPEHRKTLLRLVEARRLMELGRADGGGWIKAIADPGAFPSPDFEQVLAYMPKRKQSQPTVGAAQDRLRRWIAAWEDPDAFAPLPSADKGGTDFLSLWAAAFAPFRDWVRCASLSVAAEVSRAYREFRLGRGVLTFDDQVSLARELFDHPAAARRIREKQYRVILDEAQDTDPTQFSVLLETTRSPSAEGIWPDADEPPQRGHFCMVGDFQQSIYGSRANLAVYRQLHDALIATTGEALTFSVTFRLDQKPLSFIDTCFPVILHGTEGQAAFVSLHPRPAILPGQVNRLELGEIPDLSSWNDARKARFEAERVAGWLRQHGLENLRARTWSDVAILCPRKAWFSPLRQALRSAGFEVQVQSERDVAGDSPAFAWFTALLVIMAHPRDAFEMVGVLREVFGQSDHDLAVFAEGHGERFHLTSAAFPGGAVGDTLRLLAETHQLVSGLPLYAAALEVVRATCLRDRLLTLPAEEFEGLETELDHLLTRAAQAEAGGQLLAEFVEQLREDFSAPRTVRAPRADAVQLITAQKAKGSEWSAVLVPFLARRIRRGPSRFPRLVRHAGNGVLHPALSGDDIGGELKQLLEEQETQEMQRLLYVTLTRAKQTLVLVDDETLFRGKGRVQGASQLHFLQAAAAQSNREIFATLPIVPENDPATTEAQTQLAAVRSRGEDVATIAPWVPQFMADAHTRAAVFVKRNPSALAEAEYQENDAGRMNEATPRPAHMPSIGALYGTWWHGMIEHLDWRRGSDEWQATFERALPSSPDRERSQREWDLFLQAIQDQSETAAWLTGDDNSCRSELPFLWRMSTSECLEGTIDLAVRRRRDGAWLILDWKTNAVGPSETDALREHYEAQLAAYWKAVQAMLKTSVRAVLYATATGQWLSYSEAQLAARWERVSADPMALAEALADDTQERMPK